MSPDPGVNDDGTLDTQNQSSRRRHLEALVT